MAAKVSQKWNSLNELLIALTRGKSNQEHKTKTSYQNKPQGLKTKENVLKAFFYPTLLFILNNFMVYHKNIQHFVHEKPPIIKLLQRMNLIIWVIT